MKNKISFWRKYFQDRGIDSSLIESYLGYAEKLAENKVPIIFELEHLSALLGIDYLTLCKMVNGAESFYREFSIPKRNGELRKILAPYPSLLSCQRWIYSNILLHQKVHSAAHGFIRKKSIVSNAAPHLKKPALLKMDLKDFFTSIPISWPITLFKQLGYAHNVSYYLSALCCHNEYLPQGAATSPQLTNILLYSLDARIDKLCAKYRITYTRYADDMTFSGDYIPARFSRIISSIIEKFGLKVNEGKTKLHLKDGQRIVTGISVNGTHPKIPRGTKREIRKEIYFIKTYGLLSHLSKRRIRAPNYLNSIEGKLVFWTFVEPNNTYASDNLKFIRSLK